MSEWWILGVCTRGINVGGSKGDVRVIMPTRLDVREVMWGEIFF